MSRHASDYQYRCRKTDGTGTAASFLTPMFQAWANSRRIQIVPGTLNLCAEQDLKLPLEYLSLRPWDDALALPQRKATPGYDPRLYFVVLNHREPAWLFRWSAPDARTNFVGNTPSCVAHRRCELIAETDLSHLWQAGSDPEIWLRFVGTTLPPKGAA